MAKSHTRSPRLSLSRSISRVRVHSPSLQRKRSNSMEPDQQLEFLRNGENSTDQENIDLDNEKNGNKVMVVVDSSLDAKGALEWALSHTIQNQQDTLVLLYVVKASKQGKKSSTGKLPLKVYEKLHSMKNTCQMRRPGLQVEIAISQGTEKGPIIVEEAKRQKISLLALGQRKTSITWRFLKRWASKKNKAVGDIVSYCIQNSSCMTIAVRRKSSKLGGYLITTKRHKNFWLLA